VAKVAGEPVTTLDVQREARMMLRQQFPRGGAQTEMLLPYFSERAAQTLISRKALVAEAQRLGLRVTDDEARDELQQGMYAATFFPGGKFVGQQQYENILQNADLSVSTFEQGLRDQILLDKLRNLVTGSALVTDDDVRKEFARQNTKVKFEYAVIRKDDLLKQINPNEAELKAFYERNKATYNNSIPEKRKVRYVVLDSGKIEAGVSVSHEDLQAYYDQHRDDYRVPEQVNVSHILIKTPAGNVIVDTSSATHAPRHKKLLQAENSGPIKYIILTHAHADHMGGIALWKEPGTEIIAQRNYVEFVHYVARLEGFFGPRNAAAFNRAAQAAGPWAGNFGGKVEPTILFDESYKFKLGGVEFQLFSTPGETPDHLTVWIPAYKAAFIGDNYYGITTPEPNSFPNLYAIRGTKPRWALD
jgi:glyoxylase-like metal-dependent hydrolase (beta-lactamase superfamily II)